MGNCTGLCCLERIQLCLQTCYRGLGIFSCLDLIFYFTACCCCSWVVVVLALLTFCRSFLISSILLGYIQSILRRCYRTIKCTFGLGNCTGLCCLERIQLCLQTCYRGLGIFSCLDLIFYFTACCCCSWRCCCCTFCRGFLISSILLGYIQSILRRCYRTIKCTFGLGIVLACAALSAFSCASRPVTEALASSAALTLSSTLPCCCSWRCCCCTFCRSFLISSILLGYIQSILRRCYRTIKCTFGLGNCTGLCCLERIQLCLQTCYRGLGIFSCLDLISTTC